MGRQEDRWEVVWRAKEVMKRGNWAAVDVETTGLRRHIIQWAV